MRGETSHAERRSGRQSGEEAEGGRKEEEEVERRCCRRKEAEGWVEEESLEGWNGGRVENRSRSYALYGVNVMPLVKSTAHEEDDSQHATPLNHN